jgi:hypothetical protein
VTFPFLQELPEGERLPGETGNVATPTLPGRGEAVQGQERPGIVTGRVVVVTLCFKTLKRRGVFAAAKRRPVTKRGARKPEEDVPDEPAAYEASVG